MPGYVHCSVVSHPRLWPESPFEKKMRSSRYRTNEATVLRCTRGTSPPTPHMMRAAQDAFADPDAPEPPPNHKPAKTSSHQPVTVSETPAGVGAKDYVNVSVIVRGKSCVVFKAREVSASGFAFLRTYYIEEYCTLRFHVHNSASGSNK